MKKIIYLLLCFTPLFSTVKAQNIEELLDRLAVSEKSNLGAEPADLFSSEEKLVLQEYFNNNNPSNPTENRSISQVFAASVSYTKGFGHFPLSAPFNMSMINSSCSTFGAGDQDGSGNYYGLTQEGYNWDNHVFKLVKINPATGQETIIGPLINRPGQHYPTGLSWNSTNQTMYVLTSDLDVTNLYTIDLTTATLTLIGETGNSSGIWLAIDNSGNAFVADIITDQLYSVDLNTAAGTFIGSIGVDITNGQDADFDPATGILYSVGYHGGGNNRLYSVNTTTGQYTSLGSVNNNGVQITFFSIKETPTEVTENSLNGFSFYPNPATDILNLKSSENINNVCIYNLLNQQLIRSHVKGTDLQLDISFLKAGTYIMNVEMNGKIETYKLIND
ncbi:MAG: T9SS type A sorting domain-containing protein [Bacteroidales bacterium]|nr:T9SS type A sorting domain-containing protein [Bacteroidales bacterium]